MADLVDQLILEPYEFLAKNQGKQLRKELINAFNHWLGVNEDHVKVISAVVCMLHNASLIIDDIEDGSTLRRGKPAAHCVFGIPMSINSANYVYFMALDKLLKLDKIEAVQIFTEQLLTLHRGQGMDLHWRCSFKCPTEEEYREMVVAKTGGLFGLGVRLMQLFSTNNTDFKPLLDMLGIFFQIRDDYANLVDTSYHHAKTYAEDLTEGKFSFPIVCSIQRHPHDHQVINVLYQRTNDPGLKRYCVQHMAKQGTLDYTADVLVDLELKCQDMISSMGGNPILSRFVEQLGRIYRTDTGKVRRHEASEFDSVNATDSGFLPQSLSTKHLISNGSIPPRYIAETGKNSNNVSR